LGEAAQGDQKQQGRVGKEIGERREGRGGGEVSGGGRRRRGSAVGHHRTKNGLPGHGKTAKEVLILRVHLESMSTPKNALSNSLIDCHQDLLN
jgi:hypothetical protein